MIQKNIARLIQYGLTTGLVPAEDVIYTTNRVLELLKIDSLEDETEAAILTYKAEDDAIVAELPEILGAICDYAYENGILEENTIGYRDLFDTKVMSLLVDRPSNIIKKFSDLYAQDPKKATDFYYKFSQDTDYIRRYRIAKDRKWVAPTEYG